MIKVSRWWVTLSLVMAVVVGALAPVALAEDPTPTPVAIPEGVKVAGMPEVLPTEDELKAAIPPSLKELGQGKKAAHHVPGRR